MKNIAKMRSGFTLVELLVTITILSIISVVAYQNFGGAVDKALSARKSSDVSTIETSLQQYKLDKGYYPSTDTYDVNEYVWGYRNQTATPSNTIRVNLNGEEIDSVWAADIVGGGNVNGIGSKISTRIGSKGTISQNALTKKYLTTDLYDPEVGDVIVKNMTGVDKLADLGIGRYTYAIYNEKVANSRGSDFNIAFTIKKENSTDYITKIVGSYDENSCTDSSTCPETLIGSSANILKNGDAQKVVNDVYATPTESDQGIPYGITEFVDEDTDPS